MLLVNKYKNPSQKGNEVENEDSVSDVEVDNIVGVGNSSELEVLLLEDFEFFWSHLIEGEITKKVLCYRKWIPLVLFSVNFDPTKSRPFIG